MIYGNRHCRVQVRATSSNFHGKFGNVCPLSAETLHSGREGTDVKPCSEQTLKLKGNFHIQVTCQQLNHVSVFYLWEDGTSLMKFSILLSPIVLDFFITTVLSSVTIPSSTVPWLPFLSILFSSKWLVASSNSFESKNLRFATLASRKESRCFNISPPFRLNCFSPQESGISECPSGICWEN